MCLKGDFAHVAVLEEIYERLKRQPRVDKRVEAPSQEVDEDEEGDADEVGDGETMVLDPPPAKPEPIIDEEGFQLVQGKGRKKGRN